jgi:predicted flap endonuclease-1-like 5' DNA nuclease
MSNPALVPLLAGVLIGWVTYFLIDLFFLRRPKPNPRIPELEAAIQRCGDDLRAATTKRDSLQADLDVAVSARNRVEADLQARQQELADCKSRTNQLAADLKTRDQRLADLQAQLGTLQASFNAATSARANVEAELALRDQKLAAAQAKLGQLNDEVQVRAAGALNLENDLKTRDQRLADLQAQLDALRAERDSLNSISNQVKGDLRICGEELSNARSRIAALQTELDAAKVLQDQQAAVLQSREQELVKVGSTLDTPRAERAASPGPAVASKSTVLPLSFSAPPEVETYATECPQHLSDVKGIGTVYEQKLYEAGIGTFWVLANLENEQLKKLLDIQDFQNVNLDELRADALRLAQETNSIGRVWNRMQPDDFEAIGGIGYTYEKRLYDAGVCTYRALAEATIEQLHQICKPPAFRVPDFAVWIAAAKKLLERK